MLTDQYISNHSEIVRFVAAHYGTAMSPECTFVPMGLDSWNYIVGRYWLSLRRDFAGHSPAAYIASAGLREIGLEFAVGPTQSRTGRVVHQLLGRSAVVFPHMDIQPLPVEAAVQAAQCLHRLHSADPIRGVPASPAPQCWATRLDGTLHDLGRSRKRMPTPYGTPLRAVCGDICDAVLRLIREWRSSSSWINSAELDHVMTHGDPSRQNFSLAANDILLLDWGGLSAAPPERDWFHMRRSFGEDSTAGVSLRSEVMRHYEIEWWLTELYEYTVRFSQDVTDDADDKAAWERLLDVASAILKL